MPDSPGTLADSAPPPTPPAPASAPSLATLFESEEGPLLQFALGLVRRRSVAEDLVQEAFLRLQPLYAEIDNPRAWLYRSLRNLALNHLRDHRRETDLETDTTPADTELAPEALARLEALGQVRLLLSELPPEDRDLIRLKYHEDLKYDEIGRRTGLNPGTVGYRLHHLLKGLADSLRRVGVQGSQG